MDADLFSNRTKFLGTVTLGLAFMTIAVSLVTLPYYVSADANVKAASNVLRVIDVTCLFAFVVSLGADCLQHYRNAD